MSSIGSNTVYCTLNEFLTITKNISFYIHELDKI